MNPSFDSQPAPQKPEQFAAYLRQRVQEAVTASVHHASLSQQYLSLSQRFSALAEQASAGNATLTLQLIQQLEREVNTGIPASPMTAMQPASTALVVTYPVKTAAIPATNHAIEFPEVSNPEVIEQAADFPPAGIAPEETAGLQINESAPPNESAVIPEGDPMPEIASTLDSVPEIADAMTSPEPLSPAAMEPSQSQPESASLAQHSEKPPHPVSEPAVPRRRKQSGQRSAEPDRGKAKKSDSVPQSPAAAEELTSGWRGVRRSTAISLVIHGAVLFLLALRQLDFFDRVPAQSIPIFTMSDSMESDEELISLDPPAEVIGEQLVQKVEEMIEMPFVEPVLEPSPELLLAADLTDVALPTVEIADAALPENPGGTGSPSTEGTGEAGTGGGIGNRSQAGRQAMLKKYGGSAGSESAVGSALEWLAARQRVNGTWDFVDVGPCTLQGSVNNPIGGTAYALLPFLAAGQTHKEGQYKKQVQAGLDFLTSIGVAAPAGYDLRGVVNKADDDSDPNYAYYVQGAATLALCEAYGMTKDRKLKPAAEGAVAFLVNSQDPRGGGWRYNPQQGGSTSATTIQVMALKAAEKAGIRVSDATWKGVSFYLDSVSVDGNGRYGYEVQKKEYAMSVTSMALLSRMYLGWGRDDGDLRAGIALIEKSTTTENYYTNYFATQVMKNWGGSPWERWNARIRDELVARQETEGPAKGSWAPRDRADYSKSGGRLLTTCLATLTLEVYYRYQPLLPEMTEPASLQAGPATVPSPPADK